MAGAGQQNKYQPPKQKRGAESFLKMFRIKQKTRGMRLAQLYIKKLWT
jgi:hypothetical protein